MSEPSPYREAAEAFCKKWKLPPENFLVIVHASLLEGAEIAMSIAQQIQTKPQ